MKKVLDLTYVPPAFPISKKSELKTVKSKSIGEFCIHLIRTTSFTNEEIAKKACQEFGSRTTPACIAWYRNKLRKKRKL
jgi:hypothetical protein